MKSCANPSILEAAMRGVDAAPSYFLHPELERRLRHGGEHPPALTPPDLRLIAADLVESGQRTAASLNSDRRLQTLGHLATRFLDHTSPHRLTAERLLPASTGYAPRMVAEALDLLFRSLQVPALEELVRSDRPRHPGRPPRLVFLIAAATVFPPSIVGATAALLLGSPVLIKSASAEPVAATLWAHALATRDSELARLVAVLPWPRTRLDLTRAAIEAADAVLAHGDDTTIAAIRAAAPPTTRIIAHGHRVSAAILGASALATDSVELARGLARDVALYDQQGCLSPHTVFVEETSDTLPAREFAVLLAAELSELERSWPRSRLDSAGASSLRQFLLARELAGDAVLGGYEAGWAVVLDRDPIEPELRFEYSPLGRTVILKRAPSVAAAIDALAAVRDRLQAVGLAVSLRERIALARRLGLYDDVDSNPDWAPKVRLCPVGTMQSPPLTWPADGQRPLGALWIPATATAI
jgi:hypothetical protein